MAGQARAGRSVAVVLGVSESAVRAGEYAAIGAAGYRFEAAEAEAGKPEQAITAWPAS